MIGAYRVALKDMYFATQPLEYPSKIEYLEMLFDMVNGATNGGCIRSTSSNAFFALAGSARSWKPTPGDAWTVEAGPLLCGGIRLCCGLSSWRTRRGLGSSQSRRLSSQIAATIGRDMTRIVVTDGSASIR